MFDYQASADLLKDKIILVTGASSGIGRAAAKTFAAHGATVLLHGRDVDALESCYDEIDAAGHAQPAILPLDLNTATYDDFIVMQNSIGETFGRLDGILHNAGVLGRLAPIANTLTKDWEQIMQVNVNAPFMLTRTMLPLLEESPNASVVFTSSSVGRKGRAYWGGYSVSKFATEGLMQVLADEMENVSNIRFNTLNPGATDTRMRRQAYPAEDPSTNPQPEAIMPAYLYLMGSDSATVNGQALNAQ
ncbi:putative oxidoreductase YciK [BD1-7 clade bacterium]|uniref:Putative oxidoreductase YciK n=1 Tax=BD1-7 clade bacterium TaxID=2029982 RepID=A0A5S9PAM9_9GAMM|nr:putative oxidoreductase YciK [BD1-7 clade bacterium]